MSLLVSGKSGGECGEGQICGRFVLHGAALPPSFCQPQRVAGDRCNRPPLPLWHPWGLSAVWEDEEAESLAWDRQGPFSQLPLCPHRVQGPEPWQQGWAAWRHPGFEHGRRSLSLGSPSLLTHLQLSSWEGRPNWPRLAIQVCLHPGRAGMTTKKRSCTTFIDIYPMITNAGLVHKCCPCPSAASLCVALWVQQADLDPVASSALWGRLWDVSLLSNGESQAP